MLHDQRIAEPLCVRLDMLRDPSLRSGRDRLKEENRSFVADKHIRITRGFFFGVAAVTASAHRLLLVCAFCHWYALNM
jgi:hypothetical protein